MSGAAVFDTRINRVIGIVSEYLATSSNVDNNLALAIPFESMIKTCPFFKNKNAGLTERLRHTQVIVSSSMVTYQDEMEDVSIEDLEFLTSKILNSQNQDAQGPALVRTRSICQKQMCLETRLYMESIT
jgi:hypothetical protein